MYSTSSLLLASSSKSPDALFSSLHSSGLPNTPDAHAFVSELFNRAPRKSKHKSDSTSSVRKQAEKEAKALQKQQYGFLLEEEDQSVSRDRDTGSKTKSKSKEKESGSKDKRDRHTRKRETDGRDWESDEEERQLRKRMRRSTEDTRHDYERDRERERGEQGGEEEGLPDLEDEDERRERERLQDLKERDAFAERMKEKDREKTKKIVQDHSSKRSVAAVEAHQRRLLADDATARVTALPGLREHSRQEYLTKREIQQIELLRKEIQDEEELFRGMKVSRREQRELDLKKETLRLVEERLKINDRFDGYQLPEDYFTEQGKIDRKRKENVLYQRYEEARDAKDSSQFVTDVDQWEASQTRHSTFKTGAMDKVELAEDYDYVFDESQTIKFVMEKALEGENYMSAKDKLLDQQIREAEQRGMSLYYIFV